MSGGHERVRVGAALGERPRERHRLGGRNHVVPGSVQEKDRRQRRRRQRRRQCRRAAERRDVRQQDRPEVVRRRAS